MANDLQISYQHQAIQRASRAESRSLLHHRQRRCLFTAIELDISRASLPSDASEETCQALEKMFSDNKTLEWLDMSGEDSRLETTKLGVGVNRALRGLQYNETLRVLYIRCKHAIFLLNSNADSLQTRSLVYRVQAPSLTYSRPTGRCSISTAR